MSIKGMFEKVDLSSPVAVPGKKAGGAQTAPGRLMQFTHELDEAQRKLAEFEGSLPTRRLDPKRIRASKLRNRHDDAFRGAVWEQFKADIAAAGGNTQPIKVRPLRGDADHDYELVFGHRRHRACLEAGINVLALIEEVSDRDLFEAMTRENVGRNDLTPWEWGQHYRRGLEMGLYTTQAQLAAANQMSPAHVTAGLQIAGLPEVVVNVFPSPLDLQWRWGARLAELQKVDEDGLKARAVAVAGKGLAAPKVFAALNVAEELGPAGKTWEIQRDGKRVAVIEAKGQQVGVRFAKGAVPAKRVEELRKLIDEFLRG